MVVADELPADDERLGEPLGLRLHGIVNTDAQLAAVAEQALNDGRSCGVEMSRMSRMPASISVRQRIVDHRLVVDRQQLLADARSVSGYSRVPEPPARMMPFMLDPPHALPQVRDRSR